MIKRASTVSRMRFTLPNLHSASKMARSLTTIGGPRQNVSLSRCRCRDVHIHRRISVSGACGGGCSRRRAGRTVQLSFAAEH